MKIPLKIFLLKQYRTHTNITLIISIYRIIFELLILLIILKNCNVEFTLIYYSMKFTEK